jgi:hypothetical protein
MLLHTEYAEVSDVGANPLLPVKLRLKPALTLFTRRFEAQLHWQPDNTTFKARLPASFDKATTES